MNHQNKVDMTELDNNNISVIKQDDPNLPEYLDFEKLRREGLKHIGELSGKIWTDHNVHDPGVTILEVLVYALMDLGYKTNLPFEDIIASQGYDDNFLTPLEILTNNPVTITDYRKLLLEVPGVRNAWLEVTNQEKNLYLDSNNDLSCNSDNSRATLASLNGLYKIYIEKENDIVNDQELISEVKKIVNTYRNLCEDYTTIHVLKPIEVGACVEVELHEGGDESKIYEEIFRRIRQYIQPEIRYYTLQELLDKGKNIDEIFAGRPYRKDSFGFVDTEEIESFDRRKMIYLSDLYHTILTIEGVRKIKKIALTGAFDVNDTSSNWENKIPKDCVPVFSMAKTCIDLFTTKGAVILDKSRIRSSFSFNKKFRLSIESLNNSVDSGLYRKDLDEYYSIQNDFPVVYGIGEDGVPESSTLERKTQALQFKGYLLFYDQILANYTAQLANLRTLFSLKSEHERTLEEQRTYFTQIPDSVPGIENLLRFYDQNEGRLTANSLLAVPVANDEIWQNILLELKANTSFELMIEKYCKTNDHVISMFSFTSSGIRDIYINQFIDSLCNERYTIEILKDKRGYFFSIQADLPNDFILVGIKRYVTTQEARTEAKHTVFLATMQQSYHLVTETSSTERSDQHFFDITYTPLSYIDLIQELTENDEEYVVRRKQFLDHLLARFGEEFTEYTLLQYKENLSFEEQAQKEINDQSEYISDFAEVSRNRGKAFDYLQNSWNTNNVSGFEKRVSLRSGIETFQRRNLCNFEVVQSFRIVLKDWANNLLFRSNKGFETVKELKEASLRIIEQLKDPNSYKQLEKNLNGFDANTICRMFSEHPREENITVTKYNYHQELCDTNGESIVRSNSTKMRSEKVAIEKREDFVKNINTQDKILYPEKEYRLLPLERENCYLDANVFPCDIQTLITWKWHMDVNTSKEIISSETVFQTADEAWQNMIQDADLESYLTQHDSATKWRLPINGTLEVKGSSCYPDPYRAVAAWRQAKVLGSAQPRYKVEEIDDKFRILIQNEKGATIATSNDINPEETSFEKCIEACVELFSNINTQPEYDQEKNKFGFQVLDKSELLCTSYCVYDSEKQALQDIETVFKLGNLKKNYLLSGDQANPEYSYILKDQYNLFLALPPKHFETAPDRTKSLNAMMRYLKNNTLPVFVKEEPRRYTWSLHHCEEELLVSSTEFSSKARAQSNFDKTIVAEVAKENNDIFEPHCYEFCVVATPVQYKYIYGCSNTQKDLDPIFISHETYNTRQKAEEAYVNFMHILPKLKLQPINNKTYQFALYQEKKGTPVVVQYTNGKEKASKEKAKQVLQYISEIYPDTTKDIEHYIDQNMIENQNGNFEWRFYKKNTPLAINPYRCPEKESSNQIQSLICDQVPPINLKNFLAEETIICPEKNPNQYHYQVSFTDDQENTFVLNSYNGYDTYEEAHEAWKGKWMDLIEMALYSKEYNDYLTCKEQETDQTNSEEETGQESNCNICVDEIYKSPTDSSCDPISFVAVIPENIRNNIEGKDHKENVIEYYTKLAALFPIRKHSTEVTDENYYTYKVETREPLLSGIDCSSNTLDSAHSLLWESVHKYDTKEAALKAYQHFYTLAGTSNNCKIFCDHNEYYVGFVEVLAESANEFISDSDAWDTNYPSTTNECGQCVTGGVREFTYAAEDDKNYQIICDEHYWKFKIVSPTYFLVDHTIMYDAKKLRNIAATQWIDQLKKFDWSQFITNKKEEEVETREQLEITDWFIGYSNKAFCDFWFHIQEALHQSKETLNRNEFIKIFLLEKYEGSTRLIDLIDSYSFDYIRLDKQVNYFPVYKTATGYRYRIYWKEYDNDTTPDGLQACGCETNDDESTQTTQQNNDPFPFISSNEYSCATEAIIAFQSFCDFAQSEVFTTEEISKTTYGAHTFQIVDKKKELAYHPQQYESLQEVKNAIQRTKASILDTGMHLVEHILLRPKDNSACQNDQQTSSSSTSDQENKIQCLLPVCPEPDCTVEWQPNREKGDPCIDSDVDTIKYIPGSDPYSFWATVALPSWHRRFRTKTQRQAFEQFLYKEVPAMVGLNILWLSPQNMCKFEDTYRKWLQWKQKSETTSDYSDGDKINCEFTNDIATLRSEPVCETVVETESDCNCNANTYDISLEETSGTLFWYDCPLETSSFEASTDHTASETDTLSIKEPSKTDVKEEKPKAKKSVVQTKNTKETAKIKSSTTKKTTSAKTKSTKTTKQEKPAKSSANLLSKIRKRKPQYLANVNAVADKAMAKTKSYERTIFFIENTPNVLGYNRLVDFFNKYSLQKDNNIESFLELLKNATWHLFDHIVLSYKEELKGKDVERLQKSLTALSKKGMSLPTLFKEWKSEDLKTKANPKPLSQIKKLVK